MVTTTNKDVIARLVAAAADLVCGAMRYSDHGGTLKGLFTLNIDGTPKPVLLVGSAHGSHDDGGMPSAGGSEKRDRVRID